jgi:serine protease Do
MKNGEEYQAELIGADPPSDLAVLKIDAKNLPVAKLGNSDAIEVGETVIAIGNPFGLEQTVTQGIVSAKKRSQVGLTDYEDFIQTDASINPGNSGGPLINLNGEIIGINTAIFSRSGGSMGIGFSIPINMARQIMISLIDHGKFVRGFLGVVIQDINKELAEALGVQPKEGVLIANVGPKTPAGKSGIRQQDIILTFNGKTVKSTTALRNAVAGVRPGIQVPVELLRSGKKMRLMVTIGEQPKNMQAAIEGPRSRRGRTGPRRGRPERSLGIELEPLTQRLREQLGYQNRQGVVVSKVKPGGPAAEKGFRNDMLIERINSKVVRTVREFRTEIAKVKKGASILMLVRFRNSSRFIVIKKP